MRTNRWICACWTVLTLAGAARADDGMPALLQFAEQYQQKQPTKTTETPAATPALPEPTLLRQWTAGLGRAWRGTPDEARFAALTSRLKKDLAGVKQEAETARRQADAFRQKAETAQQSLVTQQQANTQEQDSLRGIIRESERKLAQQDAREQATKKALQTLQAQQKGNITTAQLAGDRQLSLSYAAGSALGGDIQALLDEKRNQGVTVNRQALLAGVTDSVTGHLLLPREQLEKLREEADRTASTAQAQQLSTQQRQGQDYQTKFNKQKGVKKSAMGFWYRVDYAGRGKLTDDTIVDVVVKEQLTDGTVIQDMGLSGKVLSQPLSAFPPLFREAMGHLQDHGSITMVVPPELAYGDTGYPPKVPPGATMVYELRIDNSQPSQKQDSD